MSTVSALCCPRCGDPLQDGGYAAVRRCPACEGALVVQSALQPMLRKLTEELKSDGCLSDVILEIPDKGSHVDCPQCGSQMENYGYLSSSNVQIDGCLKCELVWTDPDELGVMAALHARSTASANEMQELNAKKERKNQEAHSRALRRIRRSLSGR